MVDQQSLLIFVTGVVGRAMGSGKFQTGDIAQLTENARSAFIATFGEPEAVVQTPPSRWGTPAPKAFVQPMQAPQAGGEPVAEGKPFRVWGGDKIRVGKKPSPILGKPWGDVTWAEAYQAYRGGSAPVRGYLEFLSKLEDRDPQYAASNERTRQRALALLAVASQPVNEGSDREPF